MSEEKGKYRKQNFWFWTIIIIPFVLVFLLFNMISRDVFGPLPTFEQLEYPDNNLASLVYSEDGELLGSFYLQNRTYVDFKDLSPHLVNALIATEDIRFHNHSGIDAKALGRVLVQTVLMGRNAGGGSTVTQQLAKNLFGRDTTRYRTKVGRMAKMGTIKFKEWITAVRLERNYTKDEILVMYLNTVFYGSNSYGIKAAAKTFFNTTPDSLKVQEAALLVGVVNAPSRFSPTRHPERAKIRRDHVLSQMHKYGFMETEIFDSISVMPIELNFSYSDHNEGLATYFRAFLRKKLSAKEPKRRRYVTSAQFKNDSLMWANDPLYGWCNKNRKPDGSSYNLFSDGLRIYTTVNSKMQQYAEDALEEHIALDLQPTFQRTLDARRSSKVPFSEDLDNEDIERIMEISLRRTERYRKLRNRGMDMDSIISVFNTPADMTVFSWNGPIDTTMTPLDSIRYYKHFLRPAFMSMDPKTGHVKAYIGGADYRYFKFDGLTQGKRQVGSTIKPFVYTLAMQEGYTPCTKVPLSPITFEVGDSIWTPKNSGNSGMEGQDVSLKWGLAKSNNWISAWVMKQFPPRAVVNMAHKLGIKSYIDPVVSVFLGTAGISLKEMVGAYSTYANKGVHTEPVFVTRIEDKNGNVLATFTPLKEEAINEHTAYLMLNLMQGVTSQEEHGTAQRLRWKYQFEAEIAGKTGTTQNNSDGWFMGITPRLVSGAWVGGEDRSIRFVNTRIGQGANMALPIWALYMKKVYADSTLGYTEMEKFEKPLDFNINLDCNTNQDPNQAADPYEDDEEDDIFF